MLTDRERYEQTIVAGLRTGMSAHNVAFRERDLARSQELLEETVSELRVALCIGQGLLEKQEHHSDSHAGDDR